MAPAPAWPPRHSYSTACAHGSHSISTQLPAESTTTMRGFAAARRSMRATWAGAMAMSARSAPSVSRVSSRPRLQMTTSAVEASSQAASTRAGSGSPDRGNPGSKPTNSRPDALTAPTRVSTLVALTSEEPAPW